MSALFKPISKNVTPPSQNRLYVNSKIVDAFKREHQKQNYKIKSIKQKKWGVMQSLSTNSYQVGADSTSYQQHEYSP